MNKHPFQITFFLLTHIRIFSNISHFTIQSIFFSLRHFLYFLLK